MIRFLLSAWCGIVLAGRAWADEPPPTRSLEALQALGARIEIDPNLPGSPVIKIILYGPKVTDDALKNLSAFTSLRDLDLSSTAITNEGLVHLGTLRNLEVLNLGFTRVTDAGLVHVARLTTLKELHLHKPCKGSYLPDNRFTNQALVHLKSLTKLELLDLDWNMLTDAGLVHFHKMTNLRSLTLGYQTGVTGRGLETLRQQLPKARIH